MYLIETCDDYEDFIALNENFSGILLEFHGGAFIASGNLVNGKIHSETGPAVLCDDGEMIYYLNGNIRTEREWEVEAREIKLAKFLGNAS